MKHMKVFEISLCYFWEDIPLSQNGTGNKEV